jgi:hypothetical protein
MGHRSDRRRWRFEHWPDVPSPYTKSARRPSQKIFHVPGKPFLSARVVEFFHRSLFLGVSMAAAAAPTKRIFYRRYCYDSEYLF